MCTAIWWVRRDLRLADNQALAAALAEVDEVIPVFIFDPDLLASPYAGAKRLAFLLAGLRCLKTDLQARGSRLIIRRGHPVDALSKLLAESQADIIFAEEDYSPYARQRDAAVIDALPLRLVDGLTVHAPTTVLKANGKPYTVYTPYSKSWKSLLSPQPGDLLSAPEHIATPSHLSSEDIPIEPELPPTVPFQPGEAAAQKRLQAFAAGEQAPVYQYAEQRNRPDLESTSQLSPYLRFGMLSARQAVVAALQAQAQAPNKEARKGAETWLNELIWREFYMAILHHFPHVRGQSFRPKFENILWDNNEAAFAAWCEGCTGYPIVDAAMRQLAQSGWVHNRTRMITASFLVKDLLIDWRWGERWFMQHLVDGDPAANNGGWQWTAGTGVDAAPYFRVFNPVLQSKKFDPNGEYIRRWVPELANVPSKYIHEPAKMPFSEQRQTGCIIGQDYAKPIINHAWARERTLATYNQAKESIR